MAEQRKSSHGQAFNLEELADIQVEYWATIGQRLPPLYRWTPPATAPGFKVRPRDPADSQRAARVRTEVKELLERPESRDQLREAFVTWLEGSPWRCEQCDARVDKTTLRVPPPEMVDGQPRFRLFCSDACAAA